MCVCAPERCSPARRGARRGRERREGEGGTSGRRRGRVAALSKGQTCAYHPHTPTRKARLQMRTMAHSTHAHASPLAMEPWILLHNPTRAPVSSLIILFVAWKVLLLAIAFCSPGPGYDSSTQILFRIASNLPLPESGLTTNTTPPASASLTQKLVRWDSIYFVPLTARGYTYEQEWAFGWGFTTLVAFVSKCEFFSKV